MAEYGLEDAGAGDQPRRGRPRPPRRRPVRRRRPAPVRRRLHRPERQAALLVRSRAVATSRSTSWPTSSPSRPRRCIDGDCDLLLVETSQDMLEVKAAMMGVQDAFARTGRKIPLQVQVTLDPNGRMLLGTDIARGAGHARADARGRHRHQLLDRPRAHARAAGVPGRALVAADLVPAQRGPAAERRRPGGLPAAAATSSPARWPTSSTRFGLNAVGRLLRHDAGAHPAAGRAPSSRGARAADAAAAGRSCRRA